MRRWLIPVVVVACSKGSSTAPSAPDKPVLDDPSSASVSSPPAGSGTRFPAPDNPDVHPPTSTAPPTDHKASAAAIFDATNYVAPAELAYSKKLKSVIYPACGGGEGPGEHCSLAGFDNSGASVDVDAKYQVSWHRYPGDTKNRQPTIDKLVATLDALETVRLDRQRWTGTPPLSLPSFGTLSWDDKAHKLIATRDGGGTTKVGVDWGDRGGPVNVFSAADAPLAVVQLRVNPASGGRESAPYGFAVRVPKEPGAKETSPQNEGYVVFIQLVVVPRP
jgi:hypothetical protein